VIGLAVVVLMMVLFCFYFYFLQLLAQRSRKRSRQRLEDLIRTGSEWQDEPTAATRQAVERKPGLLQLVAGRVQEAELFQAREDRLLEFLRRAGVGLRPQEWLVLCGVLFAVPLVFGLLIERMGWGLLLGLVAGYSPVIYAKRKVKRRTRAFDRQLGDMLAIMSNSLKTGYSFLQAVQMIAGDMAPPIADEFERMLREIRMGIPTEEALVSLNERVQSQDFDLIVTAIVIQRQIGGNLAEILDSIADTIRERVRIQGEIKALTAQGRFSAIIFMILPVGIAALLYTINPEYVGQLFTNPIGWVMIGLGVIGQVIGGVIIRKIVTIEV
jgi:tight adherence protein B